MNGSAASASGSASDGGSDVGSVHKTMTTDSGDSCTWYAQGGCYNPRSCYDCLNVLLPDSSCGIDTATGACMSVGDWMASSLSTSSSLYPSAGFTYCASTDATCSECNANWLDAYLHTSNPPSRSDICYGEGGCICLAACAEPTRVSRIIDDICPLFGGTTTRAIAFGAVGVAVCLCFALLAWLTRWCLNRFAPEALTLPTQTEQRERRRRRNQLPRREPSGPQLDLSGWKAMREQLIQSENATLSHPGIKKESDSDEEVDEDDDANASEPESGRGAGQLVITTGNAPTVEHGDAYRPMSPSQLHASRSHDS